MISAISVKDRLKNQAAASGRTFQEALTVYGSKRTVQDESGIVFLQGEEDR